MKNKRVTTAIQKALVYLASQQRSDGGFESYSSPTTQPFFPDYTYRTTFFPALMLSALSGCQADAEPIRAKLAQFLLSQRSKNGSFNYWARDSKESKLLPYPDDLDDTFCALSALYLYDTDLVDEVMLAQMVKLLVAVEVTAGGPYRTWLVSKTAPAVWRDVDSMVNANIAYFLSLVARPLPSLTGFMADTIQAGRISSPYYPTAYSGWYYMARAYDGPARSLLTEQILAEQHPDGHWHSPLATALSVSALLRLGTLLVSPAIDFLLQSQADDGSWGAEAFCVDPKRGGHAYYGGAATLTTAFVIEALELYVRTSPKTQPTARRPVFQGQLLAAARKDIGGLSPELRRSTLAALEHTLLGKNGKEVSTLSQVFYASLRTQPQISPTLFGTLSLANLYGWVSYTIYDDFLDNEGQPKQLPVANALARLSLQKFVGALPEHAEFRHTVRATFDAMDNANSWEIAHCRFEVQGGRILIGQLPRYGQRQQLAQRSLGHTLPPLGVLAAIGVPPSSEAAQLVVAGLRHYIIARQLNDDAHDWKEDLRAGHISYVVAVLLRELRVAPGEWLPLDQLVAQAEKQFWHHTLASACRRIRQHMYVGREALSRSELLTESNELSQMFDAIELTVRKTLRTVDQAERFLQAYKR